MAKDSPSPALAPVVPLIVRGDLAHYRFLAQSASEPTLRALVLLMADDLEEVLEITCPSGQGATRESG